MHGEPARGARVDKGADQAMHHDRLGFAAQRQFVSGLEGEAVLGQGMGGAGHEDASRRRCQKPGRRVHRVARHRVSGRRGVTETAGNNRSGVDADMKLHWLPEPCRPLLAELGAAGNHIERGVERTLRVVLMSHGCTKYGKHGIADEFFDKAVLARDRPGEGVEQRILERAHVLGVEPLGKSGVARDVGEEHGDLATVSFAMKGSCGPSSFLCRAASDEGRSDSCRSSRDCRGVSARGCLCWRAATGAKGEVWFARRRHR